MLSWGSTEAGAGTQTPWQGPARNPLGFSLARVPTAAQDRFPSERHMQGRREEACILGEERAMGRYSVPHSLLAPYYTTSSARAEPELRKPIGTTLMWGYDFMPWPPYHSPMPPLLP